VEHDLAAGKAPPTGATEHGAPIVLGEQLQQLGAHGPSIARAGQARTESGRLAAAPFTIARVPEPDELASGNPSREAPEWLELARHEERRGELLAAYDIADRGLAEHPGDVGLAFRAVLALARAGSTGEAARRFDQLGLSAIDSEDVAALSARIEKDRALAATGAARRRLAAAAAASYRRVADTSGSYFPAINAATLTLVAGDVALARALAADALRLVDLSADESYYAAATRAGARLVLGDTDAARAELQCAEALHGGDFGALSTTRRQLRLVCTITGTDQAVLSPLAGPAVAHYCGHMIAGSDRAAGLRRFDEAGAAACIADVLGRRPVGFAYGSLAGGADILWAEGLLNAGAELHVVMPFALEDFVESSVAPSGPTWVRRFHRCLDAAVSVTYATEDRFLGDDSLFGYGAQLAMGLALLRARFLDADVFQLAVWDGEPPGGTIGTAADVETWRRTGHGTVTVTPVGTHRDQDGPATPATPEREAGRVVRSLLMGDMRGSSKLIDAQYPAFARVVLGAFAVVLARYDRDIEYRNTWGDGLISVLSNAPAAARCALDLQRAMAGVDLHAAGLPAHLAFRLSGHVGPVFLLPDPVLGRVSFMGSHLSRTARIEPVTPPGAVYVTEAFAALLELSGSRDLGCDYVGHLPAAKDYGRLRMYHLRGRSTSVENQPR
jgi:hypothetical protein